MSRVKGATSAPALPPILEAARVLQVELRLEPSFGAWLGEMPASGA